MIKKIFLYWLDLKIGFFCKWFRNAFKMKKCFHPPFLALFQDLPPLCLQTLIKLIHVLDTEQWIVTVVGFSWSAWFCSTRAQSPQLNLICLRLDTNFGSKLFSFNFLLHIKINKHRRKSWKLCKDSLHGHMFYISFGSKLRKQLIPFFVSIKHIFWMRNISYQLSNFVQISKYRRRAIIIRD